MIWIVLVQLEVVSESPAGWRTTLVMPKPFAVPHPFGIQSLGDAICCWSNRAESCFSLIFLLKYGWYCSIRGQTWSALEHLTQVWLLWSDLFHRGFSAVHQLQSYEVKCKPATEEYRNLQRDLEVDEENILQTPISLGLSLGLICWHIPGSWLWVTTKHTEIMYCIYIYIYKLYRWCSPHGLFTVYSCLYRVPVLKKGTLCYSFDCRGR